MSTLAWIAVAVFAAAYVLIATEKINRVAVALGGASIMLAIGATDAEHAFFSEEAGIDWNVIFLLLGMMLIVGVLKRTGLFEYLAIWSAKKARGRPFPIMVILVVVTAVVSAALDNVTTVLLVAPVTLLVCERLGVPPIPFLIAEVHGVQHRRRGHPGRRPAEHHHRQPVGVELQRLPERHGPVGADRARRVHRPVPDHVPQGVPLRRRARGSGDGVAGARTRSATAGSS